MSSNWKHVERVTRLLEQYTHTHSHEQKQQHQHQCQMQSQIAQKRRQLAQVTEQLRNMKQKQKQSDSSNGSEIESSSGSGSGSVSDLLLLRQRNELVLEISLIQRECEQQRTKESTMSVMATVLKAVASARRAQENHRRLVEKTREGREYEEDEDKENEEENEEDSDPTPRQQLQRINSKLEDYRRANVVDYHQMSVSPRGSIQSVDSLRRVMRVVRGETQEELRIADGLEQYLRE